MFRFAAPLVCFALALALGTTAADPAGRRPLIASTLGTTTSEALDIPGVTYPRKAPPDLIAASVVAI